MLRKGYTLWILTILMLPIAAVADGMLAHPESISFDELRNRYIIANFDDGRIIELDSNGTQSLWADPGGNSLGSVIVGDTIYITQVQKLLGYDLVTGELVMDLPLISFPYIEGITSDGDDYLYVIHDAGYIIRVRISDQNIDYWVTGLGPGPQDAEFDAANNRILLVGLNVPGIRAIDVTTGAVTLVANTAFAQFDGITMDNEGYVYLSTHADDGNIYRFDPDLSEPPFLFTDEVVHPTNCHYNLRDSILAVPWMSHNIITFYPDVYKMHSDGDGILDAYDNCPYVDNVLQEDIDLDGVGDSCDNCLDLVNPDQSDADADSVGDGCDNCPDTFNPDQADTNENEIGDACEGCCGAYTPGVTGNVNCSDDGKVTLADVSRLIDFVFISKAALCCHADGNTNGSEDCKITLSDISVEIDAVFISKSPPAACMLDCEQ